MVGIDKTTEADWPFGREFPVPGNPHPTASLDKVHPEAVTTISTRSWTLHSQVQGCGIDPGWTGREYRQPD